MADRIPTMSPKREIERFFDAPVTTELDNHMVVYVVHRTPELRVRYVYGRFEVTCGSVHGAYLPTIKAAHEDLRAVEVLRDVKAS